MRSFFKIFFASFLALIVFAVICIFLLVGMVASLASKEKPDISNKSVLTLNLGQHFNEQKQEDAIAEITKDEETPGLYDVVRMIEAAKEDKSISGIYIKANGNANGFASSNELRNALIDFKRSQKFVIAHGDMMSQSAYFIANIADKIYVNPVGSLDWTGFNIDIPFLKGTLDKLDIKAQIFYAGKFKSATEPFRTDKMTPENRVQTIEWLGDIFTGQSTSSTRIDS